jgi:hypothetical protein
MGRDGDLLGYDQESHKQSPRDPGRTQKIFELNGVDERLLSTNCLAYHLVCVVAECEQLMKILHLVRVVACTWRYGEEDQRCQLWQVDQLP